MQPHIQCIERKRAKRYLFSTLNWYSTSVDTRSKHNNNHNHHHHHHNRKTPSNWSSYVFIAQLKAAIEHAKISHILQPSVNQLLVSALYTLHSILVLMLPRIFEWMQISCRRGAPDLRTPTSHATMPPCSADYA
jgi:hypothetical protein